METRTVLRVAVEGTVTSFRYPHLAETVHPTIEMPPPATIYGHVSSTLGEWLRSPYLLSFGYTFVHQGKFVDFEHLHYRDPLQIQPYRRHLLFEPRLTLYLDYPDLDMLYRAFISPYYPVALGRSQDLMAYTSVDIVTLEAAEQAYFEGTLLPPDLAPQVGGNTVTLTMARYVDERRHPNWGSYAMLRGRARFPAEGVLAAGAPEWVWADPEVCEWGSYPDLPRAVWFHSFMEASDAVPG
ncbi:MAG: CRISPR-associated protein Cas5 [Anaerolineae bacterium]|nr:CRISPR-associated protein Cas5 [Anaerolineae bacterium]